MLHKILEANGDLPERAVVTFANTGREMPQTLAFGTTPKGNCDFCFLKSEATLASMARQHPDIRMEQMTGSTFRKDRDLAEFVDFVGRQQDWIFDEDAFFCQADDGECTG